MTLNSNGYVIIGKAGCTNCTSAKNLLDNHGYGYQYIDYGRLSDAQKSALVSESRKLGSMGLPIVMYNGRVITMANMIEYIRDISDSKNIMNSAIF